MVGGKCVIKKHRIKLGATFFFIKEEENIGLWGTIFI